MRSAWFAHAFIQACLENLTEASSFPGFPHPLLAGQCSSPLLLGGSPQTLPHFVPTFPVLWWVQNWTQGARCGLQSAKSQLVPKFFSSWCLCNLVYNKDSGKFQHHLNFWIHFYPFTVISSKVHIFYLSV